jgi:hypothetical protein
VLREAAAMPNTKRTPCGGPSSNERPYRDRWGPGFRRGERVRRRPWWVVGCWPDMLSPTLVLHHETSSKVFASGSGRYRAAYSLTLRLGAIAPDGSGRGRSGGDGASSNMAKHRLARSRSRSLQKARDRYDLAGHCGRRSKVTADRWFCSYRAAATSRAGLGQQTRRLTDQSGGSALTCGREFQIGP